jgi:MSHA biogenesis protein MshK
MAGRLIRRLALAFALACAAGSSTAAAEALRDPTRPPAASVKGATERHESTGWNLQSVLISPERRYAIINGEVVAVGGAVSGAQLVAVAPEQVTLRTREGVRILQLYPDVVRPEAGGRKAKHAAGQEAAANDARIEEAGANDNKTGTEMNVESSAKIRKSASKNSRKQETP